MKRTPLLIRKKGILHITKAKHARTSWERFKGLMGVSPSSFNYALVFHLEREGILEGSIHMLFMKMPIDVMWLDAHRGIIGMKENVPAWSLNHSPPAPAPYIVELPAGTLAHARPKPREKVEWEK